MKKIFSRHRPIITAAAIVCAAAVCVAAIYTVKAGSGVKKSSSSALTSGKASTSAVKKTKSKPVKTTIRIPVLMYHSINYEKGNILRVPAEKFAAQMKWLHDNGYHTISLDELYSAVSATKPQSKRLPEKSVVITFDDGYGDNYTNAFPVIKKYHFKATVFMITSKIGDAKDNYLTAAQIKEMDANGMKVEGHTVTHPDLSSLSYKNQLKQLADSKRTLEELLGHNIYYMAYPSGKYNDNTIKAAIETGYRMCFKMKGGVGSVYDGIYKFPRAFVGEDLQDLVKIVETE